MIRNVVIFWMILSTFCYAGNLAVKPETQATTAPLSLKILESESIDNDSVAKTASLGPHTLTRVGTGIRQKRIIFVGVNVYRATLMVSDITRFKRDPKSRLALDSLVAMPAGSLIIDFKRSVSPKDVLSSFEKSFKKNGIKDSPAISQFKAAVQDIGDISTGQRISLSFSQGKLTCEFGKKTVQINGDNQFIREVFSIWLGVPADSEVNSLRSQLILGK